MKLKKVVLGIIAIVIIVLSNIAVVFYQENVKEQPMTLSVSAKAYNDTGIQVYYLLEDMLNEGFSRQHMETLTVKKLEKEDVFKIAIPSNATAIRLVPVVPEDLELYSASLEYKENIIDNLTIDTNSFDKINNTYTWNVNASKTYDVIKQARNLRNIILKILVCIFIDGIIIFVLFNISKICIIPKDVWSNRKLVANLAKNDFKQKFAGSYLGTIWAFIQPIITVLVYWFVFEKALNVGTQSTKVGIEVPFVLWLIAGLVPWFYFSEVLASGTNALIEYNYLVKKVVFKISTLPVVKAISSLFVHFFFLVFTIVLYSCYRYYPTLYTLQLIYYSFCMFVLCVGLIYMTSAIMVFFRDLSQIIGVILQVGMWMTPIMWNMDAMANRIPGWALTILKLNPMYYIVNGYRDALYNHVWFWDRVGMTTYFWIFTIVVLLIGTAVFRKLQQHFADVL